MAYQMDKKASRIQFTRALQSICNWVDGNHQIQVFDCAPNLVIVYQRLPITYTSRDA
jgi:hypothetical protein